ncbi:MAG: hypothetical protein EOO56_29990, partial [Hymenobacter sp.]
MAVSEARLRENYRRFSDAKLLRIAAEDAAKLRPEALELLRQELATRGVAAVAARAIAARLRVVSEAEIAEYCGLIRSQPCPVCCSSTHLLNATITSKVMSFLVLTTWQKRLIIACPACLDERHRDASTTSALLGWWGFPWGIIRTIQALNFNRKMAALNHLLYPTDLLKSFVVANVGHLEAARHEPMD